MESAGRTEISQLSRDATHDTSSPIFTSQLSRVQRSRCHFYHRAISPSFSSICRHLSTPSRSRRNFSNLSYIISPSFLVSNAIQVASIFSPLKGRRLLWPTYRLCAPFGRDSRQYDDPPRRTRTRNGDAPRNRDHGGRACPSNSLLELRLSQVRGNGGKSARDRRPPLSLRRRAGPTKLEQVLPTIGGGGGKALIFHPWLNAKEDY